MNNTAFAAALSYSDAQETALLNRTAHLPIQSAARCAVRTYVLAVADLRTAVESGADSAEILKRASTVLIAATAADARLQGAALYKAVTAA